MKKKGEKWVQPQVSEVEVKEDSTSMSCEGKRIGCYAGSSCGSVEIKNQPGSGEKPKEK
ncbi:MAG: hypothetical protein AAB672_02345 [Patescibacteria group bacterium]